ncbi:hypothetical protein [Brevibacterium sandarakinum]|uniref:hypothetical protein n=1 Tax=Brevibacterium sandarakinum TaxID=629680 RepID=UPI0012FD46F8|nr:hypothetical protein [Brevibacterium sandarakinum]
MRGRAPGQDSLVDRSALEHYLTTYGSPKAAAVLARGSDADDRAVDERLPEPQA